MLATALLVDRALSMAGIAGAATRGGGGRESQRQRRQDPKDTVSRRPGKGNVEEEVSPLPKSIESLLCGLTR